MRICKRKVMCFLLVLTSFTLCACQKNPGREVVTSKNDGSFNAHIAQSSSESHEKDAVQRIEKNECFYSTDNSIEYTINLNETLKNIDMPIVEVMPHYLNEEDAQRVAKALFGNATAYEAKNLVSPEYSKDDIRNKLSRWAQYSTEEAISTLYGKQDDMMVELVRSFITKYTEKYETAPAENTEELCQWQFKKIPYYLLPSEEVVGQDMSAETDSIQATFTIRDIPYRFNVETRNQNDYKANYINAYIYDGISPGFIDDRIFNSWLCRSKYPDVDQISKTKETAELMLQLMELGEWYIDQCYVETNTYGEIKEYTICINAVPVLNGVEALRQGQSFNLTSDDTYSANYSMTDVRFRFSPDGELLNFVMHSPIDIYDIVNENVSVLKIEELIEKATDNLRYVDYYNFDPNILIDTAPEELQCDVDVCKLAYSLNRIRVPNTEDHYYYVPCIELMGMVEFLGKESGDVYYNTESPIYLIAVNAIDGSIVNMTNQ